MASPPPTTLIKLATLLSITIIPLLLLVHSSTALLVDNDIEEGEEYIPKKIRNLKSQLATGPQSQSLGTGPQSQLATRYKPKKIRKGSRCDVVTNNICNGVTVKVKNGSGLLQCCKKHCRNVVGDRNNCGSCGHKCGFGELCCNQVCTSVAYNANNCGKCGKKCASGLKCEYGTCGYA